METLTTDTKNSTGNFWKDILVLGVLVLLYRWFIRSRKRRWTRRYRYA